VIRPWTLLLLASFFGHWAAFAQEPVGDAGVYPAEATALNAALGLARRAEKDGDHAAAVDEYLRAAELAAGAGAKQQATVQYELGNTYRRLNQQEQALAAYAHGLDILGAREPGLKSKILNARGIAYRRIGRYQEAITSLQQSIALREAAGDRMGLVKARANLGSLYQLQGKYALALSAYRQALAAADTLEGAPPTLRADLHTDTGLVLSELGDFEPALREFDTALGLLEGASDPRREARLFHNMAFAHFRRGEVQRSIELYDRALSLRRQVGDKRGEGKTLNNLGFAYAKLGRHQEALKTLEDAVAIARELGDRADEGRTVDSIATVYMKTGQHSAALEQLHLALAIEREVGDRGGERVTLANIGRVYLAQERPSLAIAFLKHSVNVTEQIRSELGTLPRKARQAYTETVADTYRLLADLLLRQNRILEAERVMDLLKVEELDEYLGDVRGSGASMYLSPAEEEVLARHGTLLQQSIVLGRELAELEAIERRARTREQKDRIRELRAEQSKVKKAFQEFQDSPEVVAAFSRHSVGEREQSVQLAQLLKLSEHLEKHTALLYPLILPDRLELILATTYAPPVRLPQPVSEQQLKEAIFAFRQALANRSADVAVLGQTLYRWLLQPLEEALAAGEIETIVYVPDGQLRYIPLAALHDGTDWLVRRFGINLITALSLTDFDRVPSAISEVLAGAFTTKEVEVEVAGSRLAFHGLPFARREVDELARLYPAATRLLDDDFTPDRVVPEFQDYQVVHLATHGLFVPGRPAQESFILFGNGERATLPDIEDTWLLGGVDLIVLSACETGVGGVLGNGEEIHGFGYLMQNAGANAVMASLWEVSDGGTQALMSAFYKHLKQPGTSKVEALRQAQLDLIDNVSRPAGEEAPRGVIVASKPADSSGYTHPYYWASFVLIGNGL
jgi:CHAT domain-containing protein/Tfp pilus assembly protein PilF